MHPWTILSLLFPILGLASPTVVAERDLQSRANGWESHAKYYALGGGIGNEIYISGTWTNPIKHEGRDSGPCSARIGGIDGGSPYDVSCECKITGTGPLRFTSSCFLDFAVQTNSGVPGFSVVFECTAFSSCTGTNAYYVSSAHSRCNNISGHPCNGFRVTN